MVKLTCSCFQPSGFALSPEYPEMTCGYAGVVRRVLGLGNPSEDRDLVGALVSAAEPERLGLDAAEVSFSAAAPGDVVGGLAD